MTPLSAVDPFGAILIAVSVVVVAGAGIGYWILAKKGPRLAVLLVGAVFLVASVAYEPRPNFRLDESGNLVPEYSRPLLFLDGLLGLIGLLGILMGFYVLLRRKPHKEDVS